tara:strand:+ start:710 stop:2083 length:1374 start_codon:yes stop_codon:yes gene_type:complete
MKKLFVKTFGCQMNVYDSERMKDVLAPTGYMPTDSLEDADMVILNTCHIREKASEKVFSDLGRLRKLKDRASEQQKRHILIAVAGCVAQAEGEEITRRAPWVDMVVGPQTYHRLPELVAKADPISRLSVVDTEFPTEVKFDFLPEEAAPRGPAAFLSVQEGCDKFCSFCVVPYTRGAEFSRQAEQIIIEAKRLVAAGTREITLLGQNVNAWRGAAPDGTNWGLGRLIRELAEIDDLPRLRYTTSHPLDMDDDLMSAHRDVPQLMPYLHLPVQAGSDRILKAMNRRHTADDYRRVIDRLRTFKPGLALSGDFIVGFPGETDRDFADTIKLVAEIGYASAYSFKYSPRPGTPAAGNDQQVEAQVKADRLAALQQLLDAQQMAFNKTCEGQQMAVLIDKMGGRDGQVTGRSPFMQSVYLAGDHTQLGKMVTVTVKEARQNSLFAQTGKRPQQMKSEENVA